MQTINLDWCLIVQRGEQNFDWYKKHAVDFGVEVVERKDMGILAIQGT